MKQISHAPVAQIWTQKLVVAKTNVQLQNHSLVALYNIRPVYGVGLFLQLWSPHRGNNSVGSLGYEHRGSTAAGNTSSEQLITKLDRH